MKLILIAAAVLAASVVDADAAVRYRLVMRAPNRPVYVAVPAVEVSREAPAVAVDVAPVEVRLVAPVRRYRAVTRLRVR